MAKGGFGGGISIIATPLIALTVPPAQAAAILLPILVAMDFVAIWSFRGHWSKRNLRLCLPGAIAGITIGAFTFHYLSESAIRLMVGFISITFCLNYWLRPTQHATKQPDIFRGSLWGSIAGFTSFGIHQGGPPISIFLLPQHLDKKILMGTFAVFFTVVNLVKLIPYTLLGQFDATNLTTSLILIPLAPIGVRLGYYLLHKVNELWVYRICYFFLFLVGVKLLSDGLPTLTSLT